ncbi:MAG: hypothetical protein GY778_07195 [bacterium]|nr:hypothetical protein [bacterium]
MHTKTAWVALVAMMLLLTAKPSTGGRDPTDSPSASGAAKPESTVDQPAAAPDRPAREAQFEKLLSGATLEGTWQVTEKEADSGRVSLGPASRDTYTIKSVSKSAGDGWVVFARVQYAEHDVTVPVPVRVVWAGDTPVITMDNLAIPGLGTFSARVLFHGGFYSGTWFCKARDAGGVMSGQVVHQSDAEAKKPATGAK